MTNKITSFKIALAWHCAESLAEKLSFDIWGRFVMDYGYYIVLFSFTETKKGNKEAITSLVTLAGLAILQVFLHIMSPACSF